MKNGLTRRDALKTLGIGSVAVATAKGLAAGTAHAALPGEEPGAAGAAVVPVGLVAGTHAVVRSGLDRGALRVELADGDGDSYVAVVCQHDPATRALASAGRFDVFVANEGRGDTPTNERHGLSAMALAQALRPYEAALAEVALVTLSARQRACLEPVQGK